MGSNLSSLEMPALRTDAVGDTTEMPALKCVTRTLEEIEIVVPQAEPETYDEAEPRRRSARLVRAFDLTVALALTIALLPVMLTAALLVKATSPGPAVFYQTRMGLRGRPFRIIKLRSMRHNCEAKSGVVWSKPGDSRVTWVGKILRKTHLDELPQLFNVLRGEMSMVGPRPERPEFLPLLLAKLPDYRQRLLVKPGVTGLAQVYLPPDTDIQSVTKKLSYDRAYLRRRGVWFDLRLMVATAFQAAGVPHRIVRPALSLPVADEIENR